MRRKANEEELKNARNQGSFVMTRFVRDYADRLVKEPPMSGVPWGMATPSLPRGDVESVSSSLRRVWYAGERYAREKERTFKVVMNSGAAHEIVGTTVSACEHGVYIYHGCNTIGFFTEVLYIKETKDET